MKRDDYKNALTRKNAGDAIADAFAAWRDARNIARTGDMTIDQWREAYETFIEAGQAGPVTPAPDAIDEADEADEADGIDEIDEAPAPSPADLKTALAGLDLVLSDKALAPIKAGIAAMERERDLAREEAKRAAQDAAHAAQNVVALPTPGTDGVPVHVARRVARKPLADLVKGARSEAARNTMVDVYDAPDAPAVDPNYIPPACLPDIARAVSAGLNIALHGDRGTGKSSLVRYFAAIASRPYFEIAFDEETSSTDLFGTWGIEGDAMSWVPGDLLKAMTTPGAVIDLSEISISRPGLVAKLNAILEEGSRAIFVGGRRYAVHPTVTFFATSNDNGSGENSVRFAGVRAMNDATRSRFIWVELATPSEAQFARMIAKATNLPGPAAQMLAAFEKACEKHVREARCEATPGMRAWKHFGRLALAGVSAKDCFAFAVEQLGTSDDAAVWRQEFNANFDAPAFEALARGEDPGTRPVPGGDDETRAGFSKL